MPRYTFAELLNVFFYLHQAVAQCKTQGELAAALGVSRRTVAGWFAGDYTPRTPALIERLAHLLCLTSLQADLLFYAVNPTWVKYGTPSPVLATADLLRYQETDAPVQLTPLRPKRPPAIDQIEREWQLVMAEDFIANSRRWGTGIKDDGIALIERTLGAGRYCLTLTNRFHEDVFLGGDSAIFAPPVYYVSVYAQLVQGATDADGYTLLFEEISDECQAMVRVRERLRKVSVVQAAPGRPEFQVYLNKVAAPSLRPGEANKVAMVAVNQDHWFYLNDACVGHAVIARQPWARLDVGMVAGVGQQVVGYFQKFRLYMPLSADAALNSVLPTIY